MATMGVLNFNKMSNTNGLKQVIINDNKVNKKNTKKSELSGIRKKLKILPLTESNSNIMTTLTTTTAASNVKVVKSKNFINILNNNNNSDEKKNCNPPLAVARRNARERNRVKQVNNGFAALRERIPEEVAVAFEAQGNGRGTAKKLSKVETLRMAVEYIRTLERVLEIDTTDTKYSDSENHDQSFDLSESSEITMTTPPPEASTNLSNNSYEHESSIIIESSLPEFTVINGNQYVRLPGTNTYHLLTTIYENDENIQPYQQNAILQQSDYTTHIIDSSMNFLQSTPIHIMAPMTPASVSPGTYSGQSVSPDLLSQIKQECFVALPPPNTPSDTSSVYLGANDDHQQMYDGVVTLKTEMLHEDDQHNSIMLDQQPMSEESMMEAIDWWDSNRRSADVS